jgi:hypothetical protein
MVKDRNPLAAPFPDRASKVSLGAPVRARATPGGWLNGAVSGHQVRTAPGAVGIGRVYRNLMNRRTLAAAAAGVALAK